MASGDLPPVPTSTSGDEEEMSELETLKKEIKESKEAQDKMKETIEQLVETLKDIQNKGKEKETDDSGPAAQEGNMFKLEGFNKKDMIKPPVYDMEPSTFLNWSELFTTYMMSIDSQWEGILKKLQKTDVALLPHGYRSSSDIHTFLVVLRFVVSLCCGESGIILFSDCIRNLIVCKARWAQTIRVSQTVVTLAFSVEPLALCID